MTAAEIYERARYFFPPPPPPEFSSINCQDVPEGAGVYFIHDAGRIIYVGESVCLLHRLQSHPHAKAGRDVSVIQCDKSQRRRLEAFYIGVLNPPLNRESSERCPVIYRSPCRDSLPRKFLSHILRNPGCSLSELRQAVGWREKAARARLVIERMKEWKFIREETVLTAGRSKRIYFLATRKAVA
jgi:hypothetical protein